LSTPEVISIVSLAIAGVAKRPKITIKIQLYLTVSNPAD
jgi:hypothetical protein